jgi:hypothetical protein
MSDDLSPQEIHEAIDRVVRDVLDACGVTVPPVDALALARHLGVELRPKRQKPRLPGLTPPGSPPAEPTEEQRQADAARAVADFLRPDVLARLGVEDAGGGLVGASLSSLLAQRLLVPGRWLAAEGRACGWDLEVLKGQFRTAGHELIAWRLLDLEEPCAITVVDNGVVARRRSNAWRLPRALAPAEEECQRYVHEFSRPRVVRRDGWSVQGWPLHAVDGKREVLRSVVDEE